ncbi:MAG: hypothetical protein IBJ11_00450 [Phycisphaerales bacterium]|nr:hypothetical protein [Phycisphaerales bacterium]
MLTIIAEYPALIAATAAGAANEATSRSDLLHFIDQNFFWLMVGMITIIAIVLSSVKEIVNTRSRERTRREIAAYIAEGSMTPEQGERLMAAGKRSNRSNV